MIYFISDDQGRVKIGYTSGMPEDRLKQLQTGNSDKLSLLTSMRGSRIEELKIHTALNPYRLIGEWFRNEGAVNEFVSLVQSYQSNEGQLWVVVVNCHSEDFLDALALLCEMIKRGA